MRHVRMSDPVLSWPRVDCVQLWAVPVVYSWVGLAPYVDWLDAQECERAKELRFERDRLLYVQAHLWLRRLLGHHLSLEPGRVEVVRSPLGKPLLCCDSAQPTQLHFSLSHTHSALLIGLSFDGDIGVDIEKLRPVKDLEPLGNAVLHPLESLELWNDATSDDDRLRRFFRVWTAKEAYTKALGLGLSHPFRSLCVRLDERSFELHDAVTEDTGATATSGCSIAADVGDEGAEYAIAACLRARQASFVLHRLSGGAQFSDPLPGEGGTMVCGPSGGVGEGRQPGIAN